MNTQAAVNANSKPKFSFASKGAAKSSDLAKTSAAPEQTEYPQASTTASPAGNTNAQARPTGKSFSFGKPSVKGQTQATPAPAAAAAPIQNPAPPPATAPAPAAESSKVDQKAAPQQAAAGTTAAPAKRAFSFGKPTAKSEPVKSAQNTAATPKAAEQNPAAAPNSASMEIAEPQDYEMGSEVIDHMAQTAQTEIEANDAVQDEMINIEHQQANQGPARAVRPKMAMGEKYAGVILGDENTSDYHLILLPNEHRVGLLFREAVNWAASVGGELPTAPEASLLATNAYQHFLATDYWTSTYGPDEKTALSQGFLRDEQRENLTDYTRLAACAVRRVSV